MAAAEEDSENQELNFILKCLGERGEEGELWKDFTEHVLGYVLHKISEVFSKTFENCIMLRLYGSAVEDLKCIAPDDVGDLDIVIVPKSDELTINDELIEYLPQHPMHVRIKGVDHPVLQSCLVKDTGYVKTSALKNFHPAIYGTSAPHMVDVLTRTLEVTSQEDWSKVAAQWRNSEARPALQIDYTQWFGPISRETEMLKNPQMLTNLDPAEWEWLARSLLTSRGTEMEYTKEHAEILDEYFKFANEVQTSMHEKGLLCQPQSFPILVQELLFSDRVKQLRARSLEIESRSQCNESERSEDCLPEAAEHVVEQCVTLENCHKNESGNNIENVSRGTLPSRDESLTPENADDNQRSGEELHRSTLSQSAMGDSFENPTRSSEHPISKKVTQIKEDIYDESEQNKDEDPNLSQNESNREQQPLAEKGELSQKDLQRHPDFKSLSSGTNFVFDHLFAPVTEENKAASKEIKGEETDKVPIMGGFDLVPALRSGGWPKVARNWIKRERKWPAPDIVDKVIQEGFHLVVKPPKNGGNPDCDFRISFSHAEYLLSQEMNDIQRECYRCLKKFYRAHLSKEPKGLVSFHLKNLLLQTIEETGAEMWTESNRAKCMMTLLGNLVKGLVKKDLRHFFVRSYNLFGEDYIESPEILDVLAGKAEQIMENPMRFAKALIQDDEAANQVKKEKCVPCSKPTAETASGQGHGKKGDDDQKQLTVPVENDTIHQESSSNTSYRFHDLKDIYLTISHELTNMAFSDTDHTLEALDPLEWSLVQDLREMITNRHVPVDEFRKMFEACWDIVYLKVWMNPEPNMRRRMLDAIQGVIGTWKYLLRQDDFALENVEAIAERVFDPDTEDPFDWSHLLPAGIGTQVLGRFVNSLHPRSAQPQEINLTDDIPLD